MKNFYIYFLTNKTNRVLYIGITNNLERRMGEHKEKKTEGFTKRYNLTKLVYVEETQNIDDALAREKQLKKWRREKKNALIERQNPGWQDLSL